MNTSAGVRCDGCERIEDRNPLAQDRRPPIGERDRFFDFIVPPNKADVDMLTGKVKPGKFRGIASEGDPKKLAQLHACPGCAPKIRAAFAKKNPMLLPLGPLRTLMMQVKTKYGINALRMN